MVEKYKVQLGKYHKIVVNEGRPAGKEAFTDAIMKGCKDKIANALKENNDEALTNQLLSLRVNALQIAPTLRREFVQQVIKTDVFNVVQTGNMDFISSILAKENGPLWHAATSMLSVIASTAEGVEYLTYNNNMDGVRAIIKVTKHKIIF